MTPSKHLGIILFSLRFINNSPYYDDTAVLHAKFKTATLGKLFF